MRIYLTDAKSILVTEMTWKEYQAKKKAREITPEPKTLNLSYNNSERSRSLKRLNKCKSNNINPNPLNQFL